MQPREALEQAKAIIYAMNHGAITYDKAKELCQPLLGIANARIIEIAHKNKTQPKLITFAGFRR